MFATYDRNDAMKNTGIYWGTYYDEHGQRVGAIQCSGTPEKYKHGDIIEQWTGAYIVIDFERTE